MRVIYTAAFVCIFAAYAYIPAYAEAPGLSGSVWQSAGRDLEILRVKASLNPLAKSNLIFLRTSMAAYRLETLRALRLGRKKASAKMFADSLNAIMVINANFFDEHGKPLGVVVNRGILLNELHKGGKTLTGVFQLQRGIPSIVNRFDFNRSSVSEAVQAGPRLVVRGKPAVGLKNPFSAAKRSGICIDNRNRLIFYCLDSSFGGIDLASLQLILLDPKIACREALNLDGGGSSQLYLKTDSLEIEIAGSEEIPVALALFKKQS